MRIGSVAAWTAALLLGTILAAGFVAGTDPSDDPANDEAAAAEIRALLDDAHYAEAEQRARALLAEVEQRSGEDSVAAARVLDLLLVALEHVGKFREPETLELAQRAVEIKQRAFGEAHVETARSLGQLGRTLMLAGNFDEARPLLERAVEIGERSSGPPPHPVLGKNLNSLATVLWYIGDFTEAHRDWVRARDLAVRDLGSDHPRVAVLEANVALALEDLGDFIGARRAYERALAIQQTRRPGHASTAVTLSNLGVLLFRMGELGEAKRCFSRALAINERALGPEHQRVANNMNNLAMVLRREGEYEQAIEFYERSLAIKQQVVGPDHPEVGNTLNNLGNLFTEVEDYARAESYHRRALAVREVFGADHPDVPKSLNGLADVMLATERYREALELARRAFDIRRKVLGPDHPDTAEPLGVVAIASWRLGDRDGAVEAALSAETIRRDHVRLSARALSERAALSYAAERRSIQDQLPAMAAEIGEGPAVERIWDALIRSRAVVLDEMAVRNRILHAANDTETGELTERYVQTAADLAELSFGSVGRDAAAYRERLQRKRVEKERLEQLLADQSEVFRTQIFSQVVSLADLRRALRARGAMVAYARYESQIGKDKSTETAYVAFVLGEEGAAVKAVPLGTAREIEDSVREWREEAVNGLHVPDRPPQLAESLVRRAGGQLRRLVWDPVAPHLDGTRTVFIVPDGALHLVHLAALPIGDTAYLIEQGPTLHHLSAERDLVTLGRMPPAGGDGLLALGGADFEVARPIEATSSPSSPDDETGLVAGLVDALVSLSPFRGPSSSCELFVSRRFDDLPGTRREIREIARLWRQSIGGRDERSVRVLSGARASEEAFKQLAGGQRVLHLATHGFFLGGQCASALTAEAGENPLLLSGLVLAGANRRATTTREEDGIVTAQEIAALDLSEVEWAVLSGCDTGIGEIRAGEGVLGLRRAFRVAGARTLIMSLWPVEDEAASAWMRELYRARWVEGRATAEAVRDAGLALLRAQRETGDKTAHPSRWAAFLAVGEWE